MEYNTGRGLLQMKEYGRHVQKMVDFLLTLEDPATRQRNAEAVIELMSFLNPQLKIMEDYRHKLWDHLYYMSDFQLEVENSPYPKPDRETYKSKPKPLEYPKRHPKYNHLGKNLELVINKALMEENPEKKSGFAHVIAHYMKLAYSTWHKELVHDDTIRQELNTITKGELEFTNTPYVRHRASTFRDEDAYPPKRPKFKQQNRSNNNRGGSGGGGNMGNSSRDNRGGGGNVAGRDNRGGNVGGRDNRDNRSGGGGKFGKKRF
ncbi:hypothetical protein BH10BAC3_BH10BAC3_42280 [soil metagenome]